MATRRWGERRRREPRVYKVGEVNRAIAGVLSERFVDFWVEGEVSEARRSMAGHVYFTLSDEREVALLPCVLFRQDLARSRIEPVAGARVRVRGAVDFYVQRGATQLIARQVMPAGDGDLAARFAAIRKRLDQEGLLSKERKRALPRYPRVIGVVTSKKSAALHDIIRIATLRAPVQIVVADCRTQGADAPRSIVHALRAIQQVEGLEAVIVGRGGGSAEELWCFNDERVARAIAACRVPVVCGVGHETDVTIAELVADARASTPSNAAELVVPDRSALVTELDAWERRLQRAHARGVDDARMRLERLERRLARPRFDQTRRRMATQLRRIDGSLRGRLRNERKTLDGIHKRLEDRDPRRVLFRDRARIEAFEARLRAALRERLLRARRDLVRMADALDHEEITRDRRERLARRIAELSALSPLRVLERGYSITLNRGRALTDASDVEKGDVLDVRLRRGRLRVSVDASEGE